MTLFKKRFAKFGVMPINLELLTDANAGILRTHNYTYYNAVVSGSTNTVDYYNVCYNCLTCMDELWLQYEYEFNSLEVSRIFILQSFDLDANKHNCDDTLMNKALK